MLYYRIQGNRGTQKKCETYVQIVIMFRNSRILTQYQQRNKCMNDNKQ